MLIAETLALALLTLGPQTAHVTAPAEGAPGPAAHAPLEAKPVEENLRMLQNFRRLFGVESSRPAQSF